MNSFKTKGGTELPIMDIKGKPYLQVAHRIIWFREERPDWRIETEIKEVSATHAIFKAMISNEKGEVIATAHKVETAKGFPDFVEKAETGALGRALALCGYGTQFCGDELDEKDRLADSPVARPAGVSPRVNKIVPQAPMPGDGNQSVGYVIPFGKYKNRRVTEIDWVELRNYVEWLENDTATKKKPVTTDMQIFFEKALEWIVTNEGMAPSDDESL